MKNKNIGMVLDLGKKPFPHDVRVEKEAIALADEGYNIFILVRKNGKTLSQEIFKKRITIIRKDIKITTNFFEKGFNNLRLRFPEWENSIEQFVLEYNIDVLHVHDLILCKSTLRIAKKYNLKCVLDFHENFPAALVAFRSNYKFFKRLIYSIFLNYYLFRWYEKKVVLEADRLILVVKEAKKRFEKLNIEDKTFIVSNTENEESFPSKNLKFTKKFESQYKGFFKIVYAGGGGPHRGLDTVIRSLPIVTKEICKLKIIIVGATISTVYKQKPIIDKYAKNLEFIPWLEPNKMKLYMMLSDVCLVPHNDFEHTNTTIPHKLFQYMILGKAVLVSDCPPLKKVVDSSKSGMVFRRNDVLDFAKSLIYMFKNKSSLKKMALNGYKASRNKYSWDKDKNVLVTMYNDLLK